MKLLPQNMLRNNTINLLIETSGRHIENVIQRKAYIHERHDINMSSGIKFVDPSANIPKERPHY